MKFFSFDTLYSSPSVGEPILDAVADAIRQTHTLQSDDIALLLDVRKRDLGGAVLMLTGMTLETLIHRWRIRQARELLAAGQLSEREVAYRCGWTSVRGMRRNLARAEHTISR